MDSQPMEFAQFRDRVQALVGESAGDDPPVNFELTPCVWRRGKLRVALTPSDDSSTVLASRTAADLFRVSNTLGIRYVLSDDGVTECARSVLGWLNNPALRD